MLKINQIYFYVALFFSVVLLHRTFGQDCGTINPVLSTMPGQENYVGGNLSLLCSYNTDNINATYIYYQFKVPTYGRLDTVYEFDFVEPKNTRPLPKYQNEAIGSIVDTGVSLTILSAHWKYTSTLWACIIATVQCSFGKPTQVIVSLKGKYVPHTINSIYALLLCLLLFKNIYDKMTRKTRAKGPP